jgi:peptidoglycan/LPS O-acetylase OafA/YrhL
MIQRVQSLLLVVVVLCGVCLLLFPFASYQGYPPLFLRNPVDIAPIGNYLSMLTALVALFSYKRRKLQIKLCYLIMLFNVSLFSTVLCLTNQLYDHDFEKATFLFPTYLILVSIIAAFWAGIFIKKDEELVRSADRIR